MNINHYQTVITMRNIDRTVCARVKFPVDYCYSPQYFVESQPRPGLTVVGFKFLSNSDPFLCSGLGLLVLIELGALTSQGDKVRPGGQEIKNIPGTFCLLFSALGWLARPLD